MNQPPGTVPPPSDAAGVPGIRPAGTRSRRAAAVGTAALLMVSALVATGTTPAAAAASLTMLGADVSSLQRSLDLGAKYYDTDGTARDPIDILRSRGVNYARLRIWNNPASGYSNKTKVLAQARALKAKGLKLLVDFHYSDTWADPGKQYKPAAWNNHSIGQLADDVYAYTADVCGSLKAQGTTPDSVQIGNEINTGMLWPEGKVTNNNFAPLASLLKQGYRAAKACDSTIQVLVHTANAKSDADARWFYDGIKAAGVTWDVTALSYYCMWHGSLSNLSTVLTDMRSRYGKPVVVAETAYPFTTADADGEPNAVSGTERCDGIAPTWEGQAREFGDVQRTARGAGAVGVFYWEPTWYAIKGNGWDPSNMTGTGDGWDNMAVFDWTGHLNPTIRWTP